MTEAYLCTGRRSAIGRFGGALAQTRPDDLLAHVIREIGRAHVRTPVTEKSRMPSSA